MNNIITVKEIVKNYLLSIKADGLCSYNCGCELDDLFPCTVNAEECTAAYKHIYNSTDETCISCESYYCDREENSWCMIQYKSEKKMFKKMEWISVKDKLPEENQLIIFIVDKNSNSYYAGIVCAGRLRYFDYGNNKVILPEFNTIGVGGLRASHWMPLPDLP